MDLLWKKETRHESALYVDILHKLLPELHFICSNDDKKYFQITEDIINSHVRSEKNDTKSMGYRKQGDALFQQAKWIEAMTCYNRCLCLAKIGSVNMGIGYAKRAQCFFKLKMYEECLMDLDLARFSNYPREHYNLLQMRETECLKLIADGAETVSIVPKLSFQPNESYPEMANVLKIERGPNKNWFIVATKDIKVGEVVIVEKSFISTYNKSYQKCCVCSISLTNLLPCNKCSKVLLCPNCNENILHKVECDAQVLFCRKYQSVSDTFRSILLAMDLFDDADKLMEFVEPIIATDLSSIPQKINDQMSKYCAFLHFANQDAFDWKDDAAMVFIIYSALMGHGTVNQYFSTERHRRFLMHLVFHHLCAMKCSVFNSTVLGFDNVTEKSDCLIIGTNFGHSCAPHLTLQMIDGHAVMITVRPIKSGQRVLLSQNDMIILEDVEERQHELQQDFGWKCDCERCIMEMTTSNVIIHNPQMFTDPDFQFILHQINNNDAQTDEIMKCAENFLNKYGHQKWDDLLDMIFLCYYCGIKNKCEQFGTFA